MSGRVEGKVAIVTGAASGIGAATARRLVAEGARVVLADVDVAGGEKLAAELGARAEFRRHDVTDEAQWQQLVADVEARHGRLDVLVNNAGIVLHANVEETTLEQWRRIQAVNAEGVFLGCKHAIPAMRRAGRGAIVNVSSLAALRGTPIYVAYSASKGAVMALTKSVALHCVEKGDDIRCNSIHPGGVATPMIASMTRSLGAPEAAAAAVAGSDARGMGMGPPGDVANLIVYLASDEAAYVNGAAISIDGGLAASFAAPKLLAR